MEKTTKILVAGDFAPRARVSTIFIRGKYGEVLQEITPIVKGADYSIVNLESPICDGNYPIVKTGPNLHTDNSVLGALKYAGFCAVTLANNHIKDFGTEGVINTIEELKKAGIDYIGAGKNLSDAQKILYKNIDGKTFAFINVCEHEWSIATEAEAGAAPLDLISMHGQISCAKEQAKYVIVIVHGGAEQYPYPTPRMKRTYRFLVDCGADVVVSHHQHVFCGYESYKDSFIFYGLGNFCFDSRKRRNEEWNQGFMVNLIFSSEKINFQLIPYSQCNEEPKVKVITDNDVFQKRIEELNSVIADDAKLCQLYNQLVEKRSDNVRSLLEPYTNRYLKYLVKLLGGPYLKSKRSYIHLLAHLQCESHNDIFIEGLRRIVNKSC